MQTYAITFLLKRVEQADAVEEPGLPGHYRHRRVVAARSRREAVAEIRARGGVPIELTESRPPRFRLFGPDRSARQQLLQALQFDVRSGTSAARALQRLLDSKAGMRMGMARPALDVIESGGSFSTAMRMLGLYDEGTLSILESGERTGRMPEALQTAIEFLDKRHAGNKALVGAAGWTFIDLSFAVVSIVGLRFKLLPSLTAAPAGTVSAEHAERLAAAMRQAYLVNDGLIVLTVMLVVLAVALAIGQGSRHEGFRQWAHRTLRKVPGLGMAMEHNAMSASFTVAASMLKGGVPFLACADMASRASQLLPVQRFWLQARVGVENGAAVSQALHSRLLHGAESMLIESHGSQAQLAQALGSIADNRDQRALQASRRFAGLIFLASLAYSGLAVLFTLWVVYLQNSQLLSASTPG